MTVREIAQRSETSPATVSRYFADKSSISGECRARIEKALEQMGGDAAPRRRSKNRFIAVLLPHLRLQFYQCAVRELMEIAPQHGFKLIVLPAFSRDEPGWYEALNALRPLGIIGLEASVHDEVCRFLSERPTVKIAAFGEETVPKTVNMVHINDLAAAYEGTKYLLSLGHRKICFFSNYPYGISTSFQRLTGCRKAMQEAGLPFDENVRYGELTYERGYALGEALAKEKSGYTALFAYSDEMAVGAITALQDNGVRVPEDISVLGIDGLPVSTQVRPQLTTIRQPISDMARCALAFFEDDKQTGHSVVMPHKIIVRGTCRALETEEGK